MKFLVVLCTTLGGLHLIGAGTLRAQLQPDPLAEVIRNEAFVIQQNYPDPDEHGPQVIALEDDGKFQHLELGQSGSVFKLMAREIVFRNGTFQLSDDFIPIATKATTAKALPNGSLSLTGFRDTRFNDPAYYPERMGKMFRMLEGDQFTVEAKATKLDAAYPFLQTLLLRIESQPRVPLSPYLDQPAPDVISYDIPEEGLSDVFPGGSEEVPVLGCGEYVFRLYRREVPLTYFDPGATGKPMEEVMLDEAKVLVWPRATMWMGGMEKYLIGENPEPAKIVDRLPPVSLTLRNLYPDSRTVIWLARYESKAFASAPLEVHKIDVLDFNLGPYFNPVDSPDVIHPQQPQNRALVFDHFDKYITTSGFWWIQVRTVNALSDPEEENKELGGDLIPMTITGSTIPVDFKFEVARIRTRGQITTAE